MKNKKSTVLILTYFLYPFLVVKICIWVELLHILSDGALHLSNCSVGGIWVKEYFYQSLLLVVVMDYLPCLAFY
jgi:hypothetical protein